MKLSFAPSAVRDLRRHRQFIAKDNPPAAARISQQLKKQITVLLAHPKMGRTVEELPNVREIILRDDVCRYLLQYKTIKVLRIWHGLEDR